MKIRNIKGGVYLVIDPKIKPDKLMEKLQSALDGGIDVLQIWNNWPDGIDKVGFVEQISKISKPYGTPLFINEEWRLLGEIPDIDGVHFDNFPADLPFIKASIGRKILIGVTCAGDLETVNLAHQNRFDYISFCAMFPSLSAGNCPIVLPETVRRSAEITDIPLFVSGGITPENIMSLHKKAPFNGVAVISGILNDENPKMKTQRYQNSLSLTNQKS